MTDIVAMASNSRKYKEAAAMVAVVAFGSLSIWSGLRFFFHYCADVSPQKWSAHAEFNLRPDDTLTLDYSSNYGPDGGIIVHSLPFPEFKGIVTFTPTAGKAWIQPQFHPVFSGAEEKIDDSYRLGIPAGKTVAIVTDGKGRFFTKELP